MSKKELERIFLEIIKENFKTLMENKTKLNYRFMNLKKPQVGETEKLIYIGCCPNRQFPVRIATSFLLGSRWQKTLQYPPEVLKKEQQPQMKHTN